MRRLTFDAQTIVQLETFFQAYMILMNFHIQQTLGKNGLPLNTPCNVDITDRTGFLVAEGANPTPTPVNGAIEPRKDAAAS